MRSRLGKKEEVPDLRRKLKKEDGGGGGEGNNGGNSFDGASQSLEAAVASAPIPKSQRGGGSKRKAEDNGGDEGEGEAPAEEMAEEERPHNYKTVLCKNFARGSCKKGASCGFAHGEGELRVLEKKSGGGGGKGNATRQAKSQKTGADGNKKGGRVVWIQ